MCCRDFVDLLRHFQRYVNWSVSSSLWMEKRPSKRHQNLAEMLAPHRVELAQTMVFSDVRMGGVAGKPLQHDNFPHSSYRESPNDERDGQLPPSWSSDF